MNAPVDMNDKGQTWIGLEFLSLGGALSLSHAAQYGDITGGLAIAQDGNAWVMAEDGTATVGDGQTGRLAVSVVGGTSAGRQAALEVHCGTELLGVLYVTSRPDREERLWSWRQESDVMDVMAEAVGSGQLRFLCTGASAFGDEDDYFCALTAA